MRRMLVVWVSVTLATAGGVSAQGCNNVTSQSEMTQCAGTSLKEADATLNAIYQEIVGRLKGSDAATILLVRAQRAWLGFRDAECAFSTSASADGSAYSMLVARCRATMAEARVDGLKVYLRCEEGELSCPVPSN